MSVLHCFSTLKVKLSDDLWLPSNVIVVSITAYCFSNNNSCGWSRLIISKFFVYFDVFTPPGVTYNVYDGKKKPVSLSPFYFMYCT